jgi:hypothetical protein
MAKRSNRPRLLDSYESILALRSIDLFEIDIHLRKGITKKEIIRLKDVLEVRIADIANFTGITDRTIYLKEEDDVFDQSIAGQIYSIALLYSHVYNTSQFNQRLRK